MTRTVELPVWEDATDLGLVSIEQANGRPVVRATPAGLAFLHASRRERTM